MKNPFTKIISTFVLLVAGVFLLPHLLFAAEPSLIEGVAISAVNSTLAFFANWILGLSSVFIQVAGIFLSISINLTMHIGTFFDQIPALKEVWVVVRNLSSIGIIFLLLYSSILTIAGVGTGKLKQLVASIVLAGLLINFSLFFTKVAIDASNLVSLQFYKAIAPNTSQNINVITAFEDGGLSDVFMSSLKIPQIYQNTNGLKSTDVTLSIGFATVAGFVMMVVAAFSFMAAAIMFTARTAILMFVMALSPVYFVAMVFPQLKQRSEGLLKLFTSQLFFMPAYLFLMYVALRLISSPGFKSIFNQSATGVPAIGEGVFGPTFIGVIIQFIIAFLFINAPLVVALSIGGWGGKWAPDAVSIWKGIGSWAGRNTAGRAGRRIGESFDQMTAQETFMGSKTLYKIGAPLTRNLNISQSTREALEKMEKGKYGGSKNLESIKKENKERAKVITAVQRGRKQDDAISTLMKSSSISTTKPAWETVTKMTAKELGEVDFEKLKNPVVASHLSSQQVDKLLDGDTLTEDQKNELRSIRKKALNAGLPQTDPQVRKDFIKGLSGKELAKLDEAVLTNTVVMDHLLPSQLKEMGDISGAAKATIGNYIRSRPHPAAGFMRSNQAEWS